VQQEQRRTLPHPGTIRLERHAVHVEEEPHVADPNPHPRSITERTAAVVRARASVKLRAARYPQAELERETMLETVQVIGRGRVGAALAARLAERSVHVGDDDPGLVVLCVPDRAIAEVAASIPPGPWLAHVSGATPLAALDPHTRRFGLHPLQTFTRSRGPEQLDGAFAAVTGESAEARARGFELARTLGLEPFELDEEGRAAYHAGAAMASNYLVTLRRAAGSLLEAAGAPPEALDPLMRRTIDNGFELTGPIERGDWETVDAHLAAIRQQQPELETAYRELASLTVLLAGRETESVPS
jgi:predicted short-subunit dehydrogenase-like oxidoreductase (DUF2520 family)